MIFLPTPETEHSFLEIFCLCCFSNRWVHQLLNVHSQLHARLEQNVMGNMTAERAESPKASKSNTSRSRLESCSSNQGAYEYDDEEVNSKRSGSADTVKVDSERHDVPFEKLVHSSPIQQFANYLCSSSSSCNLQRISAASPNLVTMMYLPSRCHPDGPILLSDL